MPDLRLISENRKRINYHDYEAVFAAGGCFLFADQLYKRLGYTPRGIRAGHGPKRLSHVWGQRKVGDCEGIDIRGFHCEKLLVRLAVGDQDVKIEDVEVEEVRMMITEKEYPAELEMELRALADRIFETHERFRKAQPLDEGLYGQFVKDIEDARDSTKSEPSGNRNPMTRDGNGCQ